MPPTNMTIQPGNMDRSEFDRPSMKQDQHPEHNMPAPEHNGATLKDMIQRGAHDWADDLKKRQGDSAVSSDQ